jgi:hypothetical protein
MSKRDKERLIIVFATALMTTEAAPTDPPAGDPPPGDPPPADDLATLFTPEEVIAKKASIEGVKQEEERRAALTNEQRTEEDRIKAEQAAADLPPEKYADFKVAEGVVLDPVMIEEFAPIAKELGLSQAKAQTIIDLATKMQARTIEGIFEQHEARKASWLDDAKKDAEIGADVSLWDEKDPESGKKSVALRAFNTLAAGSPGLKAMVDELGIGNHPEFIRVMFRIGQNMREDTFEFGNGGSSTTQAGRMYPSMKKD